MFDSLREFIDQAGRLGEVRLLEGADWNLEIGAVTELAAGYAESPMLLFDRIKGYPPGYRVASNIGTSSARIALAYGLPPQAKGIELVRAFRDRLRQGVRPVPPLEVATGPVKENVHTGDQVDLFEFPSPVWHELDSGRFIGTGTAVVTRDPDEGWVNLGTYRVQVQDRCTATIAMAGGHHGDIMRRKYWQRGLSCPVVVCCGQAPLVFGAAHFSLPWGVPEYDWAGGWQNRPVEVTRGVVTGLPIPASAEIALEGEIVPPRVEKRAEGPFGEWCGYYTMGVSQMPAFRVKAVLHRNEPIIQGNPPSRWPAVWSLGKHFHQSAVLWDELDRQLPGVRGVWTVQEGTMHCIHVISLKQLYGGHAKQAGLAAAGCQVSAYASKFIIVVDDDIDPSNISEVLWALGTRGDPETSIEIVRGCWGSPANPMRTPQQKQSGDCEHSLAIVLACKPYQWIKEFPPTVSVSPGLAEQVRGKWSELFSSLQRCGR